MSNSSKFLFPLRTNVEYFASLASYLSLVERVKLASLLYDRLVFEEGIYAAIVWENGVYETRIPEHLTSEQVLISLKDDFTSRGGEALFEVASSEEGPFLPLLSGNVTQRFFCEFHTLLRSLGIEQLP